MVTTDEELIKLLGGKDNKKMSKIEKRLYEGDWNSAIELIDGKLVVYNRSKTSLGVNYTEIPLENTKENISVKDIYKNIVESNYSGLPSKRGEIAEVTNGILYIAEGYDTFNNIFAPLSNYEERR